MKKLIAALAAMAIGASFVTMPVSAIGVSPGSTDITSSAPKSSDGGFCGASDEDDVYWYFDEATGTLTISGTGDMRSYRDYYDGSVAPWKDYDITEVIIENGVTRIGEYAFRDCTSLTSVTIPDSVTSIGDDAFYECSSLKSIEIPDGVTEIRYCAFENCISLTSVTIPDSVIWIKNYAFYGCSSLTSVEIPDSVTSIGDDAFGNCSSLTSVTIPDSVTQIGYYAFSNCIILESVTIENPDCEIHDYYGSTISNGYDGEHYFDGTIYGYEFSTAKNYAENYGYSFESLGYYITSGYCGAEGNEENVTWSFDVTTGVLTIDGSGDMCDYCEVPWYGYVITEVIIEDGVTSIGDSAFEDCSGLTSITIPDSVTSIGDSAFLNCNSLTSVTIPYGVTSIEDYSFAGCSSLTSVAISDSVTIIDEYAFSGCSSLTSVMIPDSVTSIGYSAFRNCSDLESITIENPDCEIYDSPSTFSNYYYNRYGDYSDEYFDEYYFYGTIYGFEDSTAQGYAEKYYYAFESDASKIPSASGFCGSEGNEENVKWRFYGTTGILTIRGAGSIEDYDNNNYAP